MSNVAASARLTVLLGGLVAAGCGGASVVAGPANDAGGDVTVEALPACPRHWRVSDTRLNPGLAVAIGEGALSIALPLAGDELVAVVHDGVLVGDFDAAFDFEAFMPGATAAYLQATVHVDTASDSPLIGTGVGVDDGSTNLRALFLYKDQASTRFDLAPTRAIKGTMRVARTGSTIVLTSTAPSGETATTSADVSPTPAVIALQFASGASGTPTSDASVRLTDFRVSGGGDFPSDTFDCDSLL
ncbi:MAG: hypothetical protein JWM82_1765 [Myxococcales bacterium]|nr:hypothetical protein [Myxococcales bacterium]